MTATTGMVKRAETILRHLGTSDLPRQIGQTSFFVARVADETVTGEETFSFAGLEYKVGEMKKVPLS
jgi:hypothetical protein